MDSRRPGAHDQGQAMVEFAVAVTIFLVLTMGIVDLGRAIYMYNGVAEAAREIARVTSVHPGATLGGSAQTQSVIDTQDGMVPGLQPPTFTCTDIAGNPITGDCRSGNWVRVTVTAPYTPVTPLLDLVGTWIMQSTSSAQIQ